MKKNSILSLFLFASSALSVSAQDFSYHLSMPAPHTHYVEVEIKVTDNNKEQLDFVMPVWAPGSYLIREFPKNVEGETVVSPENKNLSFEKVRKNTWRIHTQKQKNFSFKYRVYAFEHSVRTSFVDASHAYLNGSSVFMYIEGLQNKPSTLHITPHESFKKISTGLKPVQEQNVWVLQIPDFDTLVDSPIEIGNHEIYEYEQNGIKHKVAIYGEGNYNPKTLISDMKAMTTATAAVFTENPCSDYTFIIHNVDKGGGGLEHKNSTSLIFSRFNYTTSYDYFLSLVAHEYFHLWNVKRIRPVALGPFDYGNENYTNMLWFSEGVTSYYDEHMLLRADFIDENEYLNMFFNNINTVANTYGRNVQPVAQASFDAWLKYYRPNENSGNSTVSYYTYGAILGAILDLEIINSTKGAKSLDDLFRYLYDEFYKKHDRGFTEKEFKEAAEKIAGKKLDDFFEYIYTTKPIDYAKYFSYAGLQVRENKSTSLKLGANLKETDGKVSISSVTYDTPAYVYGLNVNDEILAIDGYRIDNANEVSTFVNRKNTGDTMKVTIVRDDKLMDISVRLNAVESVSYSVNFMSNVSEQQEKVFKKWLSKR